MAATTEVNGLTIADVIVGYLEANRAGTTAELWHACTRAGLEVGYDAVRKKLNRDARFEPDAETGGWRCAPRGTQQGRRAPSTTTAAAAAPGVGCRPPQPRRRRADVVDGAATADDVRELMRQVRELREAVAEAKALREEVARLREALENVRPTTPATPPAPGGTRVPSGKRVVWQAVSSADVRAAAMKLGGGHAVPSAAVRQYLGRPTKNWARTVQRAVRDGAITRDPDAHTITPAD